MHKHRTMLAASGGTPAHELCTTFPRNFSKTLHGNSLVNSLNRRSFTHDQLHCKMTMTTSRGTNFSTIELKQLSVSWVNISGDPIVGSGQKNQSFWDRVAQHYNANRLGGTPERGNRSLESKWSELKHDVAKFSGSYAAVDDLRISGSNSEDTLKKARELYQQKHPKGKEFAFVDCWYLLKECPRFALTVEDMASKGNKKSKGQGKVGVVVQGNSPPGPHSPTEKVNPNEHGDSIVGEATDVSSNGPNRPIGSKAAKKQKSEDYAFRIAAYAQRSIAATNERRTKVLEYQMTQNLFAMKADDVDEDCRDVFKQCRAREVNKLKRQLDLEDQAPDQATHGSFTPRAPVGGSPPLAAPSVATEEVHGTHPPRENPTSDVEDLGFAAQEFGNY